ASVTEAMAQKLLQNTGRPRDLLEIPGAGAAGGIGFGLMALAGAGLVSGSDLVAAWLDLPGKIRWADVVLTGEGRFDQSSLEGKGPAALVRQALAAGKKVHVFAGSVEPGLDLPVGLSVHAISPPELSLKQALSRTGEFLVQAVSAANLSA
ncbi:MAG: glycerate kinase, partial [Candidatus Methylacidiphilales bacterium]